MNDDLDPKTHTEYSGPVGHEKKFHKTHFEIPEGIKRVHPRDDPDWEEYKTGRWRKKRVRRDSRDN